MYNNLLMGDDVAVSIDGVRETTVVCVCSKEWGKGDNH